MTEITPLGVVVLHFPATGDVQLHRRGLFLHLLAAGDDHPALGAAAHQPLIVDMNRVLAARERVTARMAG